MLGCQNESKTASEISKIHFLGQKIKFSFWLNKCFWNVLQLVKHIQESYFYIFKVVTHSEIYLCRQHKAKNGWKPTSEISKIHFWGQKIKFTMMDLLDQEYLLCHSQIHINCACHLCWDLNYSPEIGEMILLNVFNKLQYIPETFIESKRKFDFSTSKMDFRNFWGLFSAIF